jgi:hypothetical protein
LRNFEEESNSTSSNETEAKLRNLRFWYLRDLCEVTSEVHMVCLLADDKTEIWLQHHSV